MFKGYDNILVLSGAGFGIDAGLPDYRQLHQMAQNAAVIHNIQPHIIEDAILYISPHQGNTLFKHINTN